jgi:hypothetical protein
MTQGAELPVRMAFEVATIKPIDPNAIHRTGLTVYQGGRVVIPTTSVEKAKGPVDTLVIESAARPSAN